MKIKYILLSSDEYLMQIDAGNIAFYYEMRADTFTYENNHYSILNRHHNMDDNSWIFICEKLQK